MLLGDVDANVRRRLRSSSTTTKAAPSRPAKRPRGRPPILSTRIELLEPEEPRLQGRPQTLLVVNETLRLQGRPRLVDEPSVETSRPRGRPTTLTIYKDPIADCEVPLQADIRTLSPVSYNLACKVLLEAVNQALLLVGRFRAYLSAFKLLAGPYSLRLITYECEYYTALHFIQEAVAPT